MKLLLATTNPGKAKDLRATFSGHGFDVVSLMEMGNAPDVEETGKTFEENAVLKAKAYAKLFGMPAVADDGGLEIEALEGEPGIYSRRWLRLAEAQREGGPSPRRSDFGHAGGPGYAAGDEELIEYAMKRMADVPEGKRQAQFRTVVAFATPDGEAITEEAALPGSIAAEIHPKRDPGYPYRSIFYLPELGKYAVELTPKENAKLSHRRRALAALLPNIQNYFRKHPSQN